MEIRADGSGESTIVAMCDHSGDILGTSELFVSTTQIYQEGLPLTYCTEVSGSRDAST
jgi:hypothetical protein